MKAAELRELSVEELLKKLDQSIQELVNLRIQSAVGKASNPSRVREVRRTIARIKTVLAERGVRV
ncbi:MAG: 50S ribosomal protein L29 [Armatimonadota bacterium]|nr:50S ribosomal protein L29 [Armatimonadota bacterium]MDR5702361.1 50S ribosomal protein L29 [Armatimonadota bacterium]MDR7435454.1 50S ribosomal protein L29 [Armatimonadota bacterium]